MISRRSSSPMRVASTTSASTSFGTSITLDSVARCKSACSGVWLPPPVNR
eukprot:CAMPEP_0181474496 /NCGR_PEP_ID=MMETSP1110-20121109/40687_1 /TAXON_ID=174948 /ORGANISM="Symbiodinium sp., Strain CCMP421" /LENGTH=49 /DNA_ID=CAMNT_0023599681 /DNA_START=117 /DNA_END=266 /DNA_ORIENTATION=-